MALREEYESSGNWLFRWRSFLPLGLIVFFLLALREYEYPGRSEGMDDLWEGVCLLVSFFGLGIRIFTIGHTPKGTSGRNTKSQIADTLNTTGIYSVVRHPLYLGNFFMVLGLAMFAFVWWSVVIYTLVFWVYYERIMFAEEAFLRNKFGDQYEQWAKKTPAFIPRFTGYVKPHLPFSMKNVLRREYNGFFGVVIVLFVFEVSGDLIAENKFEIDFQWAVILGVSFALWLMLRILKKKTTWLDVDGR